MVHPWKCLLMIRFKQSGFFFSIDLEFIFGQMYQGKFSGLFIPQTRCLYFFSLFRIKKKKSPWQSVRTQRSRWFSSRWPFVHTLHYICMVIGVYTDDTKSLFAMCRHSSHAPYLFLLSCLRCSVPYRKCLFSLFYFLFPSLWNDPFLLVFLLPPLNGAVSRIFDFSPYLSLSVSFPLFLCTVFCAVVGPAAFLLLCKVLFCCWFSWG